MTQWSRRDFGRIVAGAGFSGALGAAPKINSVINGVTIGAQSYSFRDMPLDAAIQAMVKIGLGVCELWQGHLEPRGIPREELRKWRLSTPISHFRDVGKKFQQAGIEVAAYNYSFRDDFTDPEIDRGFQMAWAMGARYITASSNVSTAEKVDPFAQKHRIRVGMHNHSRIAPNEFATPDDFAEAMRGKSRYIAVNLDIGHFTAANFDALQYLSENSANIVTLHIKDRKRNQGEVTPFGEGDAPIMQVLQFLRNRKLPIPANIEYEYKGGDTIEEVRRCFEYCKKALA
jgi:sugar phosphate isomerase/epimerase